MIDDKVFLRKVRVWKKNVQKNMTPISGHFTQKMLKNVIFFQLLIT